MTDVRRLRHLVDIQVSNVDKKSQEGHIPVRLCNYTDVYYGDRITADMQFMDATATPEQVARFSLRAGDVLITKDSETAHDMAAVAFVPEDLPGVVCGYHLAILRPRPERVDGRYLYWVLAAAPIRDQFTLASVGVTRFGLRHHSIKNVAIPVPSIPVQERVAEYLDRVTAEVDAVVRRKLRLIDLLRERRGAVVDRTVRCGLESVPTRESGIEWFGRVPEHWATRPLILTVTAEQNGTWGHEPTGAAGDVACVRVADFDRLRLTVQDRELTQRSVGPAEFARYRLHPGDLLLEKSGGGEVQPVGKVVVFDRPIEAVCSNFVARLSVRPDHHPRYCAYLHDFLYRVRVNVRSIKQSTGIQNLDSDSYLREMVVLPPLREQRSIAHYLDRETAELDRLAASIQDQIARLHERRSSVIAATVTGQLDVAAA